jgi:hypothetical protein
MWRAPSVCHHDSSNLPHKDTRLKSHLWLWGITSFGRSPPPKLRADTAIRLMLHGLRKIFSFSKLVNVRSRAPSTVALLSRKLASAGTFCDVCVAEDSDKRKVFPLFNHYEPNWNFVYTLPIQNSIEMTVVLCSRKGSTEHVHSWNTLRAKMRDSIWAESLFSDYFIRCVFI